MARFISRYRNHRLKGPGRVIEFQQNECVVNDQAQIDYLRSHPDYGVVIFEDKKRDEPKEYVCPNCGREFKSPQGYAAHVRVCKEVPPGSEGSENEGGKSTGDSEGEE